uniref:non-specific serine/threonine protein kinase n=1 Tax=Steinernema glaseri TaxID=37863 RepID=A0A1I8A6B0_9BILA
MSVLRTEDYKELKLTKLPEQEPAEEYKADGSRYRLTQIGELLNGTYRVIHKIGWNERATYWLAWRLKPVKDHSPLVALTIYKTQDPTFFAETEVSLCLNMIGSPHLLFTIDAFSVDDHNCIVTEATAESVQYFLRHSGFSFAQIRLIAREILMGVDLLQKAGFSHGNLNPESLFFVPPENVLLSNALKILVWKRDGKTLPTCVQCSAKWGQQSEDTDGLNYLIDAIQKYMQKSENKERSDVVRIKIGSFYKAVGPFPTLYNQRLFAGFYQPSDLVPAQDDTFMLACTLAMMVRKSETAQHLKEAEQMKNILHTLIFANATCTTAEQILTAPWVRGACECACTSNLAGGVNLEPGPSHAYDSALSETSEPAEETLIDDQKCFPQGVIRTAAIRKRRFRVPTKRTIPLRVILGRKHYEKKMAEMASSDRAYISAICTAQY